MGRKGGHGAPAASSCVGHAATHRQSDAGKPIAAASIDAVERRHDISIQRISRRSMPQQVFWGLIVGGMRFADKDMRQHKNLPRFPVILDHSVIQVHPVNQYDREARGSPLRSKL
jgi:hypothetical protein